MQRLVEGDGCPDTLEVDDCEVPDSINSLVQLLGFADAVGSSRGWFTELGSGRIMWGCRYDVMGEFLTIAGEYGPHLDFHTHYSFGRNYTLRRRLQGVDKSLSCGPVAPISAEQLAQNAEGLRQQVVAQLEGLVYYAYHLKLPTIEQLAHRWLQMQSCTAGFYKPLLRTQELNAVLLSKRVKTTTTAVERMEQALVKAGQGCTPCRCPLLFPTRRRCCCLWIQKWGWRPIKFKAKPNRALSERMGLGEGRELEVELDLFGRGQVRLSCGGMWSITKKARLHLEP